MIEWEIEGLEIGTCNCASGCPCQFNSLPTNGFCEAVFGFQIDKGMFGEVSLDDTRAAALLSWPGPIHEGKGRALIIVDEAASEAQREALLTIFSGGETEPGATIFNVFASTYDEVLQPLFKPIDLGIDVEARRGHIRVDGLVETAAEPLRNPITGEEHRARIELPNGFEYRVAEIARGASKTRGPLEITFSGTHAQFCHLHMTQSGVVG